MTGSARTRSTSRDTSLGLYDYCNFYPSTGRLALSDSRTLAQALWCFDSETIAIPHQCLPMAGFTQGASATADVAAWALRHPIRMSVQYPPLIWLAAPDRVRSARLDARAHHVDIAGERWKFALVPKLALNRSYFDETSVIFLADQPLSMRGSFDRAVFTARTIWPESFRLDDGAPTRAIEATPAANRTLVREEPSGGARSPFAAITLWEREPGAARQWEGKPVLAAILNGAQGDDDEAHGGHFAMVTGRVGRDGAIGDWLVDNFYTLETYSEKGIVASVVPLDNYLADLNSGQAWYRPSYLIVAVLDDERIAVRVRNALARVYNHFYRRDLVYDHATMNCAGISIDVLRAIGWQPRLTGPTSRVLATLGVPYFAVRERSLTKAANTFNYLTEDQTRLFPAVAFEELAADLLRLARREVRGRRLSEFESSLADDVEALVFLRVPQLPSSRAWGDWPIANVDEYRARVPSDPALIKIVPVPPRLFPVAQGFGPGNPGSAGRRRGKIAVGLWGMAAAFAILWVISRLPRKHHGKR